MFHFIVRPVVFAYVPLVFKSFNVHVLNRVLIHLEALRYPPGPFGDKYKVEKYEIRLNYINF